MLLAGFMSYFRAEPGVRQSGLGVFWRAILALTHMWNGRGCKIFSEVCTKDDGAVICSACGMRCPLATMICHRAFGG